jgi:diguanylate cyclase (GGDEF)-like protein
MTIEGRWNDALRAADDYEALARELGDEKTRGFLIQGRMFALAELGRSAEAVAAGEELLRLHRASGARASEAKTLADVSMFLFALDRWEDGVRQLGRAGWLLDQCPTSDDRYWVAYATIAAAAHAAALYETAADAFSRVEQAPFAILAGNPGFRDHLDIMHAETLLEWGMRLEHIGNPEQARVRFRRCADLTGRSRSSGAPLGEAVLACALAKLGRSDEALAIAVPMVAGLRATEQYLEARIMHVAVGVALRDIGDLDGAHREFTAAEELLVAGRTTVGALVVHYEHALLAAARCPDDPRNQVFLTSLGEYARQLWALRSQRVSTLHQARHHAQVDEEHARIGQALRQDALTGLGNRRRFDEQMTGAGTGNLLGLLLIDVDRFKSVNDDHSHTVGDRVLQEIAAMLRTRCRDTDVPVRFGGDEFAIFLGASSTASVPEVAERIRAAVARYDWGTIAAGLQVTVSTGAAVLEPGMTATELFQTADERLYQAKRAGRNQVIG